MTEIRNTGNLPHLPETEPARTTGGKGQGGAGLGGGGAALSGGLQKDTRGQTPGGTPAQPLLQSFEASMLRAGLSPQSPDAGGTLARSAREGGEDRHGRDPVELVVVPRGEALPPVRGADAPPPGQTARVEALVDRIMAEIDAGQRAQIQHGARGALTVSFPMPSLALGVSAIAVTVEGGTLTVTLSLAGKGPDEAALRDLAQSLAQRHPSKTVRICSEPGAEHRQDREA